MYKSRDTRWPHSRSLIHLVGPQPTSYVDAILVQCWPSVADGGPTLNQRVFDGIRCVFKGCMKNTCCPGDSGSPVYSAAAIVRFVFTPNPIFNKMHSIPDYRDQEFFFILNHYKCLSQLFRFIWIPMLWVYSHYKYFNSFSSGTVFKRQNLTSRDVRFWRIKTVTALKGRIIVSDHCVSLCSTGNVTGSLIFPSKWTHVWCSLGIQPNTRLGHQVSFITYITMYVCMYV